MLDITSELLSCMSSEDVVEVIKTHTPKYHGYRVTRVILTSSKLEVWGEAHRWNEGELVTSETIVAAVKLPSGADLVGRKGYLGLAPVDIEIIKNIVSS